MGKITIMTISHEDQRYNTVGDYQTDEEGNTVIKVSDLGDWRMSSLIALHELVEVLLCRHAGITDKMIDEFDIEFAAHRRPNDASEPGDDSEAPYHPQHMFATRVEKMMSEEFGVDWGEYEKAQANAMASYPRR